MRLAPIPIFFHNSESQTRKYSRLSSKVTHKSIECLESAELMGVILHHLFNGVEKQDLFTSNFSFTSDKVSSIAKGEFISKTRDEINTTGYVIDTLEAALWSFMTTANYKEGLLKLATMGKDVDNTVYGQIAGACYGYDNIPKHLVQQLQNGNQLNYYISRFMKLVHKI